VNLHRIKVLAWSDKSTGTNALDIARLLTRRVWAGTGWIVEPSMSVCSMTMTALAMVAIMRAMEPGFGGPSPQFQWSSSEWVV
jgi:hypothetical protein